MRLRRCSLLLTLLVPVLACSERNSPTSSANEALYSSCEADSDCQGSGLLCDERRGCVECQTSEDCAADEACRIGICENEDDAKSDDDATDDTPTSDDDATADDDANSSSDDDVSATADDDASNTNDDDDAANNADDDSAAADDDAANNTADDDSAADDDAANNADDDAANNSATDDDNAADDDAANSAADDSAAADDDAANNVADDDTTADDDAANNVAGDDTTADDDTANNADDDSGVADDDDAPAPVCGDGILDEECDDGNLVAGDGCSAECTIEAGASCEGTSVLADRLLLPITYRDFTEDHIDFQFASADAIGRVNAMPGIVSATLNAAGKPTFSGDVVWDDALVNGAASFAEWYSDSASSATIAETFTLWLADDGSYVNRYGSNGERYHGIANENERPAFDASNLAGCESWCEEEASYELQCDNACLGPADAHLKAEREYQQAEQEYQQELDMGEEPTVDLDAFQADIDDAAALAAQCESDCAAELANETQSCSAECKECSYNEERWCIGGEVVEYDGTPTFFPITNHADAISPSAEYAAAVIAPSWAGYPLGTGGMAWNPAPDGLSHNFHFTSHLEYSFVYRAAENPTVDVLGDDDIWVFINGQLAIDLGGIHFPAGGSVTIDATAATAFGLLEGESYVLSVFHAERQKDASSFMLRLTGLEPSPGTCTAE